MNLLEALTWFSGISFIYFGFGCFYSKFIIAEFNRYGLPSYRKTTGVLQIIGAIGSIAGLLFNYSLLFIASLGLSLLMFAGLLVRIKIKDNVLKSSPAFLYSFINCLIAIKSYNLI